MSPTHLPGILYWTSVEAEGWMEPPHPVCLPTNLTSAAILPSTMTTSGTRRCLVTSRAQRGLNRQPTCCGAAASLPRVRCCTTFRQRYPHSVGPSDLCLVAFLTVGYFWIRLFLF